MAHDASLAVRIAIVSYLKARPSLAGLGGRVLVVPDPNQIWPFVRYGAVTSVPFRGQGFDGSSLAGTIHAFARGETDDDCSALSALLSSELDGVTLPLIAPYPARLSDIRWTQTQVLRDIAERDGWHGIVQFVGTVVS